MDTANFVSFVSESPAVTEGTPASLNIGYVGDPQLDAIIDCESINVHALNHTIGVGGRASGNSCIGNQHGCNLSQIHWTGADNWDPMAHEAHGSCPFPPGFGPCTGRVHVHKELARVCKISQFESVNTNEVEVREVVSPPTVPGPVTVRGSSLSLSLTHLRRSPCPNFITRQCCRCLPVTPARSAVGPSSQHRRPSQARSTVSPASAPLQSEYEHFISLLAGHDGNGDHHGDGDGEEGEDRHGDGDGFNFNPHRTALLDGGTIVNLPLFCLQGVLGVQGALEVHGLEKGFPKPGVVRAVSCEEACVNNTGIDEADNEQLETSNSINNESLYRINPDVDRHAGVMEADRDLEDLQDLSMEQIESHSIDGTESIEEDSLLEAAISREVWGRGGLSFDSSEEE
ncbi:hypothetical protein PIB30_077158 [Stylosanthes scabra]|uniref:Uncharacterized protein n=1 Tax=Stylosanthes scabra TaxID=79078 RepID=A0ABU6VTY5_9FABA|nr:hypothetical protein [Stylosanthes scabra]